MIVSNKRSPGERRRLLAATGVIAVLALTAAACGDDSDASTDPPSGGDSPTTTAGAQPTGSPLRIGLLADQSGPQAQGQAEAVDIAEAWAADVNATGGVAGHPVELVVKDTKGDAPTGSAAAEELVGDESVVATLVVDSAGEAAFVPVLSSGGLPVVGGMGYNPRVWGALPNVWGIATTFPSVVNEQVIAAEAAGAATTAVAACAEVASCSAAAPVFEAANEALGLEYAGLVTVAVDAPDFTAECLQFVNDGVDFIQLSASASWSSGWRPTAPRRATPASSAPRPARSPPPCTAGRTSRSPAVSTASRGSPTPSRSSTSVTSWRPTTWTRRPTARPGATATWASLELFRTVVENNTATLGDNPDRAGIIAAYGTVADETLGGLLPNPVTFTANQPGPPIPCFWLYTYEDGEFSGDFEPTCPGPEFG